MYFTYIYNISPNLVLLAALLTIKRKRLLV